MKENALIGWRKALMVFSMAAFMFACDKDKVNKNDGNMNATQEFLSGMKINEEQRNRHT